MQSEYNFFSRILHRLVLGNNFIGQTAFDIESGFNNIRKIDRNFKAPVFICGLARAGTTVLMRQLHDSGEFFSLTYQNMPFILMPGLWLRISKPFHRHQAKRERAQNDGVMINSESPEAFEEIFWKTFSSKDYIKADELHLHKATEELQQKFRQFVLNALVSSGQNQIRYLSKNNNNILRLSAIKQAFPEATIIIPYRNPMDQAWSLFRQHELFTSMHAQNRFSLNYMNWLGHYEFGGNHKPFVFLDSSAKEGLSSADPNYWLGCWSDVYGYLIENAPPDSIFFDYDEFCKKPEEVMAALTKRLDIDGAKLIDHKMIVKNKPGQDFNADAFSRKKADDIYAALKLKCSLETC